MGPRRRSHQNHQAVLALVAVLASAHTAPDARRLRTGQFTYQDLDHGKPVGASHLRIRTRSDGRYEFSASITGNIQEQWLSIATPAFEPISATLTIGPNPPVFAITYHAGRVTGVARTRAVDALVPPGIIDQRIDWAAVAASDLDTDRTFAFAVYDPALGVSRATVHVGALERVQVPAGTFDAYRVTYRIEKSTGAEAYQVLVTRDQPRMMVREEFANGIVTDLTEAEP
ncbi:MAG TPA: hypothetical protein VNW46_18345 [Gemmatimonadaceae bacterium]|nr:hypothetical protein [Gemmatimonadaceae bacterium]